MNTTTSMVRVGSYNVGRKRGWQEGLQTALKEDQLDVIFILDTGHQTSQKILFNNLVGETWMVDNRGSSFTVQLIAQKFRAIRALLTSAKPSFWGNVEFDLILVSTEFQLRGLPHWHMLIWLKLPWDRKDLTQNCPQLPALLQFYDTYMSTDANLLHEASKQVHTCKIGRCTKEHGKQCRFGYPKIPLDK